MRALALVIGAFAVAVALAVVSGAGASAGPVGPLPAGPNATISTSKGELFAVALPPRSGKSWRIARAFDSGVVREATEGNIGSNVVVVFKAVQPGRTKVVFALTRGETAKAYESRTYTVLVR